MLKPSRFLFPPDRPQPGLAVPRACSCKCTLPALELTGPHKLAAGKYEQGDRMKFEKQLSSLVTAALFCGIFTTLSSAQQTAGSEVVAPAPTATPTTATAPTATAPAASATTDAALVKSTP